MECPKVSLSLISFNRLPILTTLLLAIATITSAASSPPAAVARPQATRPMIGQQAPVFTLRDQNGRRVSLADAAGTKVVLVFYRGYW
jgi:cytochrome oxidase Cu insertion factor (SCO1/SenC/PrrC family)